MHFDPYVSLSQDPWHSGARGLALGVKLFLAGPRHRERPVDPTATATVTMRHDRNTGGQ